MKKNLLLIGLVVVFGAYVAYRYGSRDETIVLPVAENKPGAGGVPSSSTQTPSPSALYKDGVYTGKVADAYYGNLQVKSTIKNGKISDVVFLQYPSDRRTSVEINTQAMPVLKSEAIRVQSAQVDIVSGATQTSQAFRESLASALSQAKA